eukprot:4899589-Alexandrium_andersonii.AAC.1
MSHCRSRIRVLCPGRRARWVLPVLVSKEPLPSSVLGWGTCVYPALVTCAVCSRPCTPTLSGGPWRPSPDIVCDMSGAGRFGTTLETHLSSCVTLPTMPMRP